MVRVSEPGDDLRLLTSGREITSTRKAVARASFKPLAYVLLHMADDGEPSKAELQSRVDRLERYLFESRRDVLKGAALGGTTLGVLGFGAGSASADASTSDSDGDIGQPGDRVDLFSDGVDANSVTTDDISITNDGSGSGIDADQIDSYDVQKNGTDGTGIINFKT